MEIIIAGAGRIGFSLARQLTREGHSVTVIDKSSDRIALVSSSLDVMTVCGHADADILRLAGAEKADLLIAATDSDETNILSCMVGKKLGAGHTIARLRQEAHYREVVLLREELGLSLTVNPEFTAANEISRILRFPSAAKVEPFAQGQAELVELRLSEINPLCGAALRDYHSRFGSGTLVCAVRRGEKVHIPGGGFILAAGDVISIVGAPKHIHELFRALEIYKKGARFVMIVGGSRAAVYLARQLIGMGIRVKVLEIDPAKCERVKDAAPKAEVVCCDGSDPDMLEAEGLPAFDAFVALTGQDEVNLILATHAMRAGLDKVVTKINEAHYADLAVSLGLDEPIQPCASVSRQVIKYIRSMQNTSEVSGVETLRQLMDGRLEVLEFRVRGASACTGKTLSALPIRRDVLLAAVIREGKCFIPRGSDELRIGDGVLAVTTAPGMTRLEDILKG